MLLQFKQDVKKCCACKEYLSYDKFSVNKAAKDGLQYKCRVCDNNYQRLRRKTPQKKKAIKEYGKIYREQRIENHEWRLKQLFNASKARAKKKNLEHTIEFEDILKAFPPNNRCPVFGFKFEWGDSSYREKSPSVDRIDSKEGYTVDNIQIISWKANRLKTSATVKELEAVVNYMKQGE